MSVAISFLRIRFPGWVLSDKYSFFRRRGTVRCFWHLRGEFSNRVQTNLSLLKTVIIIGILRTSNPFNLFTWEDVSALLPKLNVNLVHFVCIVPRLTFPHANRRSFWSILHHEFVWCQRFLHDTTSRDDISYACVRLIASFQRILTLKQELKSRKLSTLNYKSTTHAIYIIQRLSSLGAQ